MVLYWELLSGVVTMSVLDTRTAQGATGPLSEAELRQWDEDGFVLAKGVYDANEVEEIRAFYDGVAAGAVPDHYKPDFDSDEPLKRYPRVMHPHRWHEPSLGYLLKPSIGASLEQLLGEPAVACQLMYFYKPPGSPGQALHQDNFYLAVKPTTCIAAWTAIDHVDRDNGGLVVVPGTHRDEIQCPTAEEFERTKRTNLAEIPKGRKVVHVDMEPGDTLYFNGSVIHGSGPNRTKDRWRRSFIGHYMPASSTHVNGGYFPVYDFDGNVIDEHYAKAQAGGPCGYKQGEGPNYNTYGIDAQF